MRRWLVTLALAVVALPNVVDAQGFRVELNNRTVTTSKQVTTPACEARVARLPASVEIDSGAIVVTTNQHTFRHALGRRDGLSWIVTVGQHVVAGFATKPGGFADSIVAIDHTTGRVAWRRSVERSGSERGGSLDSMFAAELVDNMLAVERAGSLDIIDARDGQTISTTPITGRLLRHVCRPSRGDVLLKTNADLVAIDRASGQVKWRAPATTFGNPTVTSQSVVDGWVDRKKHRFGIVSYDRQTGKRLDSIDLGPTGGWYDVERVTIAPDGPDDVLVSAVFGIE